jgi:type II secretory pathway component PulF
MADGEKVQAEVHGNVVLPRFRYRGIDLATGQIRGGEIAGESPFAARASLRRIGFQAISLEPIFAGRFPPWLQPVIDAWNQHLRQRRRSNKSDFCDAIATMLQAGVTLDEAVNTLAQSTSRVTQERKLAGRMRDGIRSGQSLSDTCAVEPGWFDRFDIALMKAGEAVGEMQQTLIAIVQHHERAGHLGQKLFIALIYPGLLSIAGLGVLLFMSHEVLPQLVTLIRQAHHQPPSLTLQLIGLGQWIGLWWPLLLLSGIAGYWALMRAIQVVPGDTAIGRIIHGNPLARVTRRYRAAQLAWSLARLSRSGMPLLEALTVTADTSADLLLRQSLTNAAAAVARGEDFSAAIANDYIIDPEFAQLLSIGERSGELASILERIAERSHRSADRATERLVSILNPAAIIFLAVLIGLIVLACALPLAQLGDLV